VVGALGLKISITPAKASPARKAPSGPRGIRTAAGGQ
jgi:hypothetical protein